MSNVSPKIPAVKDGEVFSVGGVEFIKFPEVNGTVPVVAKDTIFYSRFGDNNDLRSSVILQKLQEEYLPQIIEAVGEENVCEFETDLTTLDGLKNYGALVSRISLPTFDFYRANIEIFDKYNPCKWWWLSTPESAQPHESPIWVTCVAPSGYFFNDFCSYDDNGVRPFCIFKSSIFKSSAQ